MTTKEKFYNKFFQDTTGEKVHGWLAMKTGKLIEGNDTEFCKIALPDDVWEFIQQENALAHQSGREEMKQECLKAVPNEITI